VNAHDPAPYVLEAVKPVIAELFDRLEADLSEDDLAVLSQALLSAAAAGFGAGWDHLKFVALAHGADWAELDALNNNEETSDG
jgi:hypothetical protein